MTREEAIENIKLIRFNAALTNANSFKEALDMAIEALSLLSLPSDLDEAAEIYVKTTSVKVWGKIDPKKDLKGYMARANYGTGLLDGLRAGAEWMAGQWETIDGEITTTSDNGWEIIRIPKKLYPLGTKVTVQIRKK